MTEDERVSQNTVKVSSFTNIPKARGFKMASLNINSLLAHIDELRIWSEDQTFDLLA